MKTNSKEYPAVQWLQGVVICPVKITEKTNEDGEVSYDWERVDLPATSVNRQKTDDQLISEATSQWANAEKKAMLDAGFMVDGTLFDSDTNARLAYAELAMALQADPVYTTPWKASDGVWVTMNAELYAQVYAAGKEHVQSVFAWLADQS